MRYHVSLARVDGARTRGVKFGAAGLALLVTSAVGVVLSAPAVALDQPVTVRVEMGISGDDGPLVYQATDVTVGAGPELVGRTDLPAFVSNPSNYCGDLTVDIDPTAKTITVMDGDNKCGFTNVFVTVASSEIASIALVCDELLEATAPCVGHDAFVLAHGVSNGVVTLSWTSATAQAVADGKAVFSYTSAVVTPPVVTPPVVTPPVVTPPAEVPVAVVAVLPATASPGVARVTPPRVSE